MNKNYFVKISDNWYRFKNVDSVKELVENVMEYTGNTNELFKIALNGCNEDNCIPMYNALAADPDQIIGVWELGEHVYGEKEKKVN